MHVMKNESVYVYSFYTRAYVEGEGGFSTKVHLCVLESTCQNENSVFFIIATLILVSKLYQNFSV